MLYHMSRMERIPVRMHLGAHYVNNALIAVAVAIKLGLGIGR